MNRRGFLLGFSAGVSAAIFVPTLIVPTWKGQRYGWHGIPFGGQIDAMEWIALPEFLHEAPHMTATEVKLREAEYWYGHSFLADGWPAKWSQRSDPGIVWPSQRP